MRQIFDPKSDVHFKSPDYSPDVLSLYKIPTGQVFYKNRLKSITGKNNLYIVLSKHLLLGRTAYHALTRTTDLNTRVQVKCLVVKFLKRKVKVFRVEDYVWIEASSLKRKASNQFKQPVGPKIKLL
jgi:hypothetical protein